MHARAARRFARHYGEMVVAMLVGMMLLYPLWMLTTAGADEGSALRSVEAESLVMAATMAVPMVAWMRFRGHRWTPAVEMAAAMFAGFAVLFPFLWAGALEDREVVAIGHVLMLLFMLLAMLLRHEEYAGHHHRPHEEPAESPTAAAP